MVITSWPTTLVLIRRFGAQATIVLSSPCYELGNKNQLLITQSGSETKCTVMVRWQSEVFGPRPAAATAAAAIKDGLIKMQPTHSLFELAAETKIIFIECGN